ncbi:MAG: hypothetical protein RBU36_09525 [Thermoanaerobaculia bacterium]|jgi:hypothetical protein|nr:hypothetical protein [Thermoanaerobaculia bacterium]
MKKALGPASLLVLTLLTSPALAQMGGGGMWNGPGDHMTNGSEALIVPAGVRGDGKNGAFFVTDLWIRARGTGTATLSFHPANAASADPAVTTTVALSQPVTFLPDLLSAQLGLAKAFGNVRITATVPIAAVARVYNQSGAGAYGLAFMGMPQRMSLTAMPMAGTWDDRQFEMVMLGLLPQPGARVNATVVNTTATTVTGTLDVVDADGSAPAGTGPKSWPFRIAGYSSTQVDDVLAGVASRFPSGGAGLQLRVRLDRGASGMVMAYAVVNDNLTNDGYVVMGNMMNSGQGMGSGSGMGM